MNQMNQADSMPSPFRAMAAFIADVFDSSDAVARHGLETELERVRLPQGQTLYEQGDPGDSMYVLVRGHLGVRLRKADGTEMVIGQESEPGASIGEMSLITGQPRAVTVYALADAELVRLSKGGFDRLAESYPKELADFAATITMPRWQRVQLARVLTDMFGELDTDALLELQEELEWQQLSTREVLFHRGDPCDAMYFVVSGRLRVVATRPDGRERIVGEVGPGEAVGEFSFLAGERHSATAQAIRETDVFKLTQPVFEHLVEQYPQVMMQITRLIIRRQRKTLRLVPAERTKAFTVALIPSSREVPLSEFAQRLEESLVHYGRVLFLDSTRLDQLYGKEGAALITLDEPMSLVLASWMSEQETNYGYILYVADPVWSHWTQRCVCQADRILVVGKSDTDPQPGPVETALQSLGATARTDLVLLHPADVKRPTGTAAWLAPRQVHTHHHVRTNDTEHYQRLARRLTGNAVGLVLSGGGARGFAHLGVLRALEDCAIQVDRIGGTSMGSLIGAGYAMGRDYARMFELAQQFSSPRQLFDYTLPFASLMASRKVTAVLTELFGDLHIEDLWRPYFCISSNLSRAEPVVHQTGPLWKGVRASIAIPGFFTPILHEGDILVDGGAMNNFPVDIMHELCGGGTVIGVNVSPPEDMAAEYSFGPSLSGWRLLWNRINPLSERIQVPSLGASLMRTLELNSVYKVKSEQTLADLVIQPDVKGFSLLDYPAYQAISEVGYQEARKQLSRWQASVDEGGRREAS
jgi:predicted acylesterase/phospholipase RssA/CRP-like cAMP-binding protein